MTSVRDALAFSYVEKYGSYVLGLLSTMVVSRLLGPTEIGVFSIGMALVGVVSVVREFGISTYLIQETELNEARIRASFTIAVALGLSLALLVLLCSIPVGRFYGDPTVTSVLVILAFNMALAPLASVSQSLLARDLRFRTLTWIRLVQSFCLALGSTALAATGLGPQSLAWAMVLATGINAAVSLYIRPHSTRLTFSRADLARVYAVGGPATVVNIIEDVITSLPELLLGRLQSLTAAGVFSRARGMSQMAHQLLARAAGPVFFVVFAERKREGVQLTPLYLKATACVTALGWTGLAMLIVLAEPVVRVLFGSNWFAVVPLMRWLCVAAGIALLTSGAPHLLLADGGARDVLHAKLVALPMQALFIGVGAYFGAEWMAIGLVMSSIVATLLLALAVKRRFGTSLLEQLTPAISSAPLALAGAIGSSLSLLPVASESLMNAILRFVVGGTAGLALAATILTAGAHPLRTEFVRLIALLRRSRT